MWEWDEAKRQRTLRERGIDFADVIRFDFASAVIEPDLRRDYGEQRLLALGLIDGRLHMLCFTHRPPTVRVISLRRANPREMRRWRANRG